MARELSREVLLGRGRLNGRADMGRRRRERWRLEVTLEPGLRQKLLPLYLIEGLVLDLITYTECFLGFGVEVRRL